LLDVPFQARKRKKAHRSNSPRKMELTNTKINHFMVGIVGNNEFLSLSWNLVTLSLFSNKKQTEK
jgi:hypothetical protein